MLPTFSCTYVTPDFLRGHVLTCFRGEHMPTFAVRCVVVRKNEDFRPPNRIDTMLRGLPRSSTRSPTLVLPPVKAKATGPMAGVTLLGFFLSVSLFIISITLGDGMSLVATLLLSFLSTLIGAANKWTLRLPQRQGDSPTPGDTVIRYPNGSFLVVKCDEDVARELYFAPEEIEYNVTNPTTYRMISLVGTLMLMLGIVALANSKLQLQFAWAAAYIFTNAAHWVTAAVPPKLHWDLSCYDVKEQGVQGGWKSPTYTEALWKAILLTKSSRWIRNGNAAPQTDVWDEWLHEAVEIAGTVECHIGPLGVDALWPGKDPSKSIIWDQPKDWDSKKAWDDIDKAKKGYKTGGITPTSAV